MLLNRQLIMIGAGIALVVGVVGYFAARRAGAIAMDAAEAVNPFNNENVFALGANEVVKKVTGDEAQTLGGWWFDLLNPRAGLAPGEETVAPGVIASPVLDGAADASMGDVELYAP